MSAVKRGIVPVMKNRVLLAVAAALLSAVAAHAQPQQQPTPTPAPEDGQARRSLRSRMFEIKHRDPRNLLSVLALLGSSVGGSKNSRRRRRNAAWPVR